MNDLDERIQLLQLHGCCVGLDDDALREIASATEAIRCEPGDVIVDPQVAVTSIYLIVHGRVRLQLLDVQGHVVVQRFQTRGGQVGAMAAAFGEAQPFRCTAEDPSVLLRIDYATAILLSRKHEAFRANISRLVATSVKQAILYEKTPTPPKIVAFLHRGPATREVSRRVLTKLIDIGETPHAYVDRPLNLSGLDEHKFVDKVGTPSYDEIRREAAILLQSGRVVFDVDMGADASLAVRAAERCEQIYWCVTPDNWESSLALLQGMVARAATLRDKVQLVWLLAAGELAPIAAELRSLTCGDVKVCLAAPDAQWGPVAFDGVERLVHLLRGVQIGVALGGGAARGMAHLGVLPALARSGITVDRIAGTSAGAMTGTLYAAGLPAERLTERFVADLRPSWLFRCLPHGEQWDLLYKYRRGRFDPMLRKYLGDALIEQLYVPMHTITVDLIGGNEVVRSGGDAVQGIVESINLPLLATPIHRDGEALVDGGLINNVPANVLTAKGCNFVIAVSVTAKMEHRFAKNQPDTPTARMRRASTIQTLLRSYLVQSHNVNALGVQPADFVIEPDATQFELSAFTQANKIAAVGEQATLAAIGPIRAMLNRLDAKLFPLP